MLNRYLCILLSAAMLFSMFSIVAFAAEAKPDTQAKYEALKAKGIFEGVDGGDPALDQTMTRAQFAKILSVAFGLKEAAGSSYSDLEDAKWASGYIEAITKAGLMEGVGENYFDPSAEVTLEQMATVWVRAFNLKLSNDGVPGKVSDWAQAYVATALKAGLIPAASDFSKPALRSQLVDSTYIVINKKPGSTEITAVFSASGIQQFQAAFNKAVDTSKVTFKVTKSGNPVKVHKVTWSKDKKTATLKLDTRLYKGDFILTAIGASSKDLTGQLSIEDERVAKIEIASDTAPILLNNSNSPVGAKVYYKILNQYGENITKTSSIRWNVSVGSVSDNDVQNGVLTISTPNNYYLRVGDKFTLTGIEQSSNTVTTKVLTVGDRSSASNVTVKSLYNPDGKKAVDTDNVGSFVVLVDVKDQYGNPLKADDLNGSSGNDGQLIVTSSNPALVKIPPRPFQDNLGPDADQLGLTLEQPDNIGYQVGGTAVISFIPRFGGTSTTYNLEVKQGAEADVIHLNRPKNAVGQGETVEIPFDAKDQYGNDVKKYTDLSNTRTTGVTLQSTAGPGRLYWDTGTSGDEALLKFHSPDNYTGPVTLMAITKSGKVSQLTLDIKEPKVPGTIGAVSMKTAMETGGAVQLQGDHIKVADQFGGSMAVNNAEFYDKYKFRVELTGGFAVNKGEVTLEDDSTNNDAAVMTVSGVTYAEIYKSGGNINIVSHGTRSVSGGIKITAVRKTPNSSGNYDIRQTDRFGTTRNYTLGSYEELPLKVVRTDSIKSYAFGKASTVFDEGYKDSNPKENIAPDFKYTGNYEIDLDLYGKLADGTKVALNPSHVQLVGSSGLKLKVVGKDLANKVRANGVKYDADSGWDTKGSVTALITAGNNTLVTLKKEITISRKAPEVTKVSLKDYNVGDDYIFRKSGGTILTTPSKFDETNSAQSLANLLLTNDKAIVAKDEYGKKYPSGTTLVGSVAFIKNVDTDNSLVLPQGRMTPQDAVKTGIKGYNNGDVFTVVYAAPSGKVLTFKVKFIQNTELNFDNAISSSLD